MYIYTHIYIHIVFYNTLPRVFFKYCIIYGKQTEIEIPQSIDGNYRANALNAGIQRSL